MQTKRYDLERHAFDFVTKRLSAAYPKNDGKQTPMRGHPVFIAQHATVCLYICCRRWCGFELYDRHLYAGNLLSIMFI